MNEKYVPVSVSLIERARRLRSPFRDGRCHCGHAASSHNALGYCQVHGNRAPLSGDCVCETYEDARGAAWRAGRDAVRALLSQPTPTAEPECICGPQSVISDGPNTGCPIHGEHSEPPRIEDLAPGTTFTARTYGDDPDEYPVRFRKGDAGLLLVQDWRRSPIFADELDPSTIRDVTPPEDAA